MYYVSGESHLFNINHFSFVGISFYEKGALKNNLQSVTLLYRCLEVYIATNVCN